jgi:hypothetical protein
MAKHEIRNPEQARISNPPTAENRFEPWDFEHWNLFRISKFEFRTSRPPAGPLSCHLSRVTYHFNPCGSAAPLAYHLSPITYHFRPCGSAAQSPGQEDKHSEGLRFPSESQTQAGRPKALRPSGPRACRSAGVNGSSGMLRMSTGF